MEPPPGTTTRSRPKLTKRDSGLVLAKLVSCRLSNIEVKKYQIKLIRYYLIA